MATPPRVSRTPPPPTAASLSPFLNSSTYFTKNPPPARPPSRWPHLRASAEPLPPLRGSPVRRLSPPPSPPPRPHGRRQFDGSLGPVADSVFAEGIVPIQRDHPHRDAGVRAGDAPVVVQRAVARQHTLFFAHGYSIWEAFSSSSSCSYSSPICFRAFKAACASASSSLDMAKPTWMSTQSPASIFCSS